MSTNKLTKYTGRPYPEKVGRRNITPVVLSDSKGKYLERKVADKHEREIKWWIKSGENTSEGYSWLQNKFKTRLQKSGIYGYMYGWALVTLHLNTRNTYCWHPKTTSQCLQRTTTSRK
jgi:hypothetical protein